jgi:hypothetical protein
MTTDSSRPDNRPAYGIQGNFLREHAPMVFDRCVSPKPLSASTPSRRGFHHAATWRIRTSTPTSRPSCSVAPPSRRQLTTLVWTPLTRQCSTRGLRRAQPVPIRYVCLALAASSFGAAWNECAGLSRDEFVGLWRSFDGIDRPRAVPGQEQHYRLAQEYWKHFDADGPKLDAL